MNREPVLRARSYKDGNLTMTIRVYGGLHYIKGNSAPYFSLTYWEHRKGFPDQCESGGAGHDHILRFWPDLADLAALHCSDIDGVPMHAESNGWYNLAGALSGAGERYHVGNSERHFPITPDPATPWKNTEYRKLTEAECLQIFADHCRIPLAEAEAIKSELVAKFNWPDMRARWREICESMKPRWKQEAEACIAKHNLVVYGDEWPKAA